MGLSLTSAMLGLGMAILGVVILILRKQRRLALIVLIAGITLISIPYGTIYVWLDGVVKRLPQFVLR